MVKLSEFQLELTSVFSHFSKRISTNFWTISSFGEETALSSVETIDEDTPLEVDKEDMTEEPNIGNDTGDDYEVFDCEQGVNDEEQTWIDFIEDESSTAKYSSDEDYGSEGFSLSNTHSVLDDLEDQLRLLNLSEEEEIIGEEILGSLEPSGYLYRDLAEIVIAVNEKIDALNEVRHQCNPKAKQQTNDDDFENYDLSPVKRTPAHNPTYSVIKPVTPLQYVDMEMVQHVLGTVQKLDPPGIGSQDLRECLLAQLRALPKKNAAQKLAQLVLEKAYEAFSMKHYEVIMRKLQVSSSYLAEALKVIRALNPKPGGLETGVTAGSIIPDFLIYFDADKSDFLIQLNDVRVPTVRVSKMYEQTKAHAQELRQRGIKGCQMDKNTRNFLLQKYNDAKFFVDALVPNDFLFSNVIFQNPSFYENCREL